MVTHNTGALLRPMVRHVPGDVARWNLSCIRIQAPQASTGAAPGERRIRSRHRVQPLARRSNGQRLKHAHPAAGYVESCWSIALETKYCRRWNNLFCGHRYERGEASLFFLLLEWH